MTWIDKLPLVTIFIACGLFQIVFIEAGYRFGVSRMRGKPNKAQMAQVRAIMGASLGLLAFMLAFSFSMAQQHYESRVQAYLLEISAIDSTYRSSDLLMGTEHQEVKDILLAFANLRIDTVASAQDRNMEQLVEMIRESERLHDRLWEMAQKAMESGENEEATGIFAQSVLAMIDAHDARLQAAFFNRVSPIIWATLYMMALLSMVTMGYQAGLTGTRSTLATWTLAVAFSSVMTLITDLDRPNMSLFSLNQNLMVEMASRMEGNESWDPSVHRRN